MLLLLLACDGPAVQEAGGSETDTDTDADSDADADTGDTAAQDTAVTDADGDGFTAAEDCDDADPRAYPGAAEVCDGADNDCDGAVDGLDGCHGGRVELDAVATRLDGTDAGELIAWWPPAVGDVTGDGLDDLLIGDPWRNEPTWGAGTAWLLLGPVANGGALDAVAAIAIEGIDEEESAGQGTAIADVDGDGAPDLGVGVPGRAGGTVLVHRGPVVGAVGEPDVEIAGASPHAFGAFMESDGERLWVGTDVWAYDPDTRMPLRGYSGLADGTYDAEEAEATLWVPGHWYPLDGLATGGDIDGDGRDDLAVCGSVDRTYGGVFVVTERIDGDVDAEDAAAFGGDRERDLEWCQVSTSGDANGDGYDDLAIGSPSGGRNVATDGRFGRVWVVPGPSLDDVTTIIEGPDPAGWSVELMGDGALMVGAPDAVDAVEGHVAWWYEVPEGTVEFETADAVFLGGTEGRAGISLRSGADFDGDGQLDPVVGGSGVDGYVGGFWVLAGWSG